MIIVEPRVELLGASQYFGTTSPDNVSDGALLIERAGRVCWKSEGMSDANSAPAFCDRVLGQYKHESIAEHASATMLFVTDRLVSHQLVRHRIAAYSQESTHYLNYAKGKFGRQISVCKPHDLDDRSEAYHIWFMAMLKAEESYFRLIEDHGMKHYEARYVLPQGLKTELVATYNFRMWKHVVEKRTELNSAGRPVNTPEVHHLMMKAKRLLYLLSPEVFKSWKEAVNVGTQEAVV